jgi:hypothetical protein
MFRPSCGLEQPETLPDTSDRLACFLAVPADAGERDPA